MNRLKLWWFKRFPSGRDRGIEFNLKYGRWVVDYPDGDKSIRFCYDLACDYVEMFGGTITYKGRSTRD